MSNEIKEQNLKEQAFKKKGRKKSEKIKVVKEVKQQDFEKEKLRQIIIDFYNTTPGGEKIVFEGKDFFILSNPAGRYPKGLVFGFRVPKRKRQYYFFTSKEVKNRILSILNDPLVDTILDIFEEFFPFLKKVD